MQGTSFNAYLKAEIQKEINAIMTPVLESLITESEPVALADPKVLGEIYEEEYLKFKESYSDDRIRTTQQILNKNDYAVLSEFKENFRIHMEKPNSIQNILSILYARTKRKFSYNPEGCVYYTKPIISLDEYLKLPYINHIVKLALHQKETSGPYKGFTGLYRLIVDQTFEPAAILRICKNLRPEQWQRLDFQEQGKDGKSILWWLVNRFQRSSDLKGVAGDCLILVIKNLASSQWQQLDLTSQPDPQSPSIMMMLDMCYTPDVYRTIGCYFGYELLNCFFKKLSLQQWEKVGNFYLRLHRKAQAKDVNLILAIKSALNPYSNMFDKVTAGSSISIQSPYIDIYELFVKHLTVEQLYEYKYIIELWHKTLIDPSFRYLNLYSYLCLGATLYEIKFMHSYLQITRNAIIDEKSSLRTEVVLFNNTAILRDGLLKTLLETLPGKNFQESQVLKLNAKIEAAFNDAKAAQKQGHPEGYILLGKVLEEIGDFANAAVAYQHVLMQDEDAQMREDELNMRMADLLFCGKLDAQEEPLDIELTQESLAQREQRLEQAFDYVRKVASDSPAVLTLRNAILTSYFYSYQEQALSSAKIKYASPHYNPDKHPLVAECSARQVDSATGLKQFKQHKEEVAALKKEIASLKQRPVEKESSLTAAQVFVPGHEATKKLRKTHTDAVTPLKKAKTLLQK